MKIQALLVACLFLANFTMMSMRSEIKDLKQQAIERGYAEWRIIPGTSNTEFKWKDEQ